MAGLICAAFVDDYQLANGTLQARDVDFETLGGKVFTDVEIQNLDATAAAANADDVKRHLSTGGTASFAHRRKLGAQIWRLRSMATSMLRGQAALKTFAPAPIWF